MYSRQSTRLDELHGLLPAQAVEILRGLFGSSTVRLKHDGPVVLASRRDGPYGENELDKDSDFVFKGRPKGIVKYAQATANSRTVTDDKTGRENTWVYAREKDDYLAQYVAGYQEQGKCESWFCSTDTGEQLDLLLAPFGDSNVSARAGDVIPYFYDVAGTPVALGLGLRGAREKIRRACCVGDWQWVAGRVGQLGQVQANLVADILAVDKEGEAFTVYLPVSSGGDPNLHTGDSFTWMEDESYNKVAIDGYLDSKIGTIDMLKPGTEIRKGWRLYNELAGLFPAGFGAVLDYNVAGATGGSHPIKPMAHVLWKPGDPPMRDDRAYIYIEDHDETLTGTVTFYGGITETNLHTKTRILTGLYTEAVTVEVNLETTGITIVSHAGYPYSPPESTYWMDYVGGTSQSSDDPNLGYTEITDGHRHGITLNYSEADFRHFIGDPGHDHETRPHFHPVEDTLGHAHEIYPNPHSHGLTLEGEVELPVHMGHDAWAPHAREDLRPPWKAMPYVVRVGPDED